MRIFTLLFPVTSFAGAVNVVSAGADEMYCGVVIPGVMELMNRPEQCSVPTYEELGQIADHARQRREDDRHFGLTLHLSACGRIDEAAHGRMYRSGYQRLHRG
jgi:hypothetical protein